MPTVVNISAGSLPTSGDSLTVSNTPGVGTDYLLAVVQLNSGSGADTAATYSVSYDSVQMTEITESLNTITRDFPTVVLFGMRSPPPGTKDAVFTVTHSGVSPAGIHMTLYNLSNVAGTTDLDAQSGLPKALFIGFDSSGLISLTTTDPNTTVFGGIGIQGGDVTAVGGSGFTVDSVGATTPDPSSGITYLTQHKDYAAAGAVTFDVSWNENEGATLAAVALRSSSAPGPTAQSSSLSVSSASGAVLAGAIGTSASASSSSATGGIAVLSIAISSSTSTSTGTGTLTGALSGIGSSASLSGSFALSTIAVSGTGSSASTSTSLARTSVRFFVTLGARIGDQGTVAAKFGEDGIRARIL